MKNLVMMICTIALASHACRTKYEHNFKETSSQLQGVYDENQLLRLSKFAGKTGLYHFETCWLNKNLVEQKNSCLPALRDKNGNSVTFALLTLQKISLRDEHKKMITEMKTSWQEYQGLLAQQVARRDTAFKLGITAAGGAAVLSLSLVQEMIFNQDIKQRQKDLDIVKSAIENQKNTPFRKWIDLLDEIFLGVEPHNPELWQKIDMEEAAIKATKDHLTLLRRARIPIVVLTTAAVSASVLVYTNQKDYVAEQQLIQTMSENYGELPIMMELPLAAIMSTDPSVLEQVTSVAQILQILAKLLVNQASEDEQPLIESYCLSSKTETHLCLPINVEAS